MILRSFIAVFLICLVGCLTLVGSAGAHSPSPEAKAKFIAEGTWEQKVANLQAFEAAQDPSMYKDALAAQQARRASTSALGAEAIDTVHVVVLLVEFPDFSRTSTSYAIPGGGTLNCYYSAEPANFDSLLFSVRGEDVVTNPTGSWTDFYMENSYGTVFIKGDVYGWFMAPNDYSYYVGSNDGLGGGAILASDACAAANDVVDFSKYAEGSYVPGVVVVHAGPGAEQGAYGIWSHRSSMSPSRYFDGVYLGGYTMQPEEQFITTGLVHMGVFAHEWGHVMGIQDWYDPSYRSEGIGDWSVMAGGSWNNGGRQPAHFDCYSKYQLGWNDVQWLTGNVLKAEIPQAETSPIAYALRDNVDGASPNIWFIENRQQVGSDQYLPGSGLLIYHFNGYGTQTTPVGQPVNLLLSVEEADGRFDLINNSNAGDATDPFPGGGLNKRHFHDYSVPNSNNHDSTQSQVSVLNISNSGPTMIADLGVVWAIPWPELDGDSLTILDVAGGNGNGLIEQGETVDVYLEVANRMRSTYWPTLSLETSSPDLVISANNQNMGATLGHLVNAQNYLPIKVTVPDDMISTIVKFTLTITTDSTQFLLDHTFKNTFEFQVPIGKAQILVIDDDNNSPTVDDRRFTDCLDRLRYPYVKWTKFTEGSPTYEDLAEYPYVFWMTGSYKPPQAPGSILTTEDIDAMRSYMDDGGNLLVGSFSIPLQLATLDPTFMADYLKATLLGSVNGRFFLGVAGSPLADGIMVFAETNGVLWNNSTPTLNVVNGGQPAFILSDAYGVIQGDVCGVTYDGAYRSVFLSFGAEMTIREPSDVYDFVVTDTLVSRIIQFFVRGSATPVEEDGGGELLPRDFSLDQN